MAIDPKKLIQVEALLKSLSKEFAKLGKSNPFEGLDVNKIKDIDSEIQKMETSLDGVKSKNEEFNRSLNDTYTSFASIVSELGKAGKGVRDTTKAFSDSANAARKLRDHQQGISILSVNQLKSQKEKVQSAQESLKSTQQLLAEEKNRITAGKAYSKLGMKEKSQYSKINKAMKANQKGIDDKESSFSKINDQLDSEIAKEQKIQKDLGITGGVLKGISKIPILGDVIDADAAVKAMEKSLRDGGSQTKALSAGFKSMGASLTSSLGPANVLLTIITFLIKTLIGADKAAGDYAKSMNTTYNEALNTRTELTKIANLSGDVALTGEKMAKTLMEVGSSLGTNAELNEADLKIMTKLTNQAGFTAGELMNIQKLSLAHGKSLEDNTKEILGGAKAYARRNKIAVNEKTILKEVNNMSASLKLSLGSSGDEMARAAVQAKKFGINLQQAENIASSLLNFEQSIENELSAELLLGRDLNFEKARMLAMNGESAKAAAEMLKQVGSSKEFGDISVIQQESIAKAMGMQREELAASLIESEALKSIGAESMEEAQKEYDLLRETMTAEEAKAAMNDSALATQFEQQSISEQMADSTQKMSELFIMMTPALETIGEVLNVIFGVIGIILKPVQMLFDLFGSIGSAISKLIGPLGKVGKVLKGVASIAVIYAAYKAYASLATIPIVGVPLGIAAAAAVTAMGFGALSKIKDGVIDPKGGLVVSGEKGSISLDKEDSIIAGTDLGGKKKPKKPETTKGGGGTSVNVDMSQTNALLQQLISVISAGGDVVLDGQKVGTALNLTAYKTQ